MVLIYLQTVVSRLSMWQWIHANKMLNFWLSRLLYLVEHEKVATPTFAGAKAYKIYLGECRTMTVGLPVDSIPVDSFGGLGSNELHLYILTGLRCYTCIQVPPRDRKINIILAATKQLETVIEYTLDSVFIFATCFLSSFGLLVCLISATFIQYLAKVAILILCITSY